MAPNLDPRDLPIREAEAPSAPSAKPWPNPCGTMSCVDIKPNGHGFTFTSTIDGNTGSVTYTRDEVTQFFGDVKAGKWDHLLG
jgi:hypothetical protein